MKGVEIRRVLAALAVLVTTTTINATNAAAVGGHSAFRVFGQGGSFTTGITDNGGTGAANLDKPSAVSADETNHRLYIADRSNNRVLVHQLDVSNNVIDDVADFVLGQANFTASTPATSATRMRNPTGVLVDPAGNRLFVSDTSNNRVLVFDTTTLATGMSAFAAIGASTMTTNPTGNGQNGVSAPEQGLALDVGRQLLFISDSNNNRVLVFDASTLATGMNASYVIGQSNFVTYTGTNSVTSTVFPAGLAFDTDRRWLFVSEGYANRTKVFDTSTMTSGLSASNVLGQTDFTSSGAGTSATQNAAPWGVSFDPATKHLYVADYGNHRVVVYDTTSITNGEAAIDVFGQPDFTTATSGVSATKMLGTTGVTFVPGTRKLYVSEWDANRVTAYEVPMPMVNDAVNVLVDPSMTFSVAGRTSGAGCNAATPTNGSNTTGSAVPLGKPTASTAVVGVQDLSVTTNATGGATVLISGTPLSDGNGHVIGAVGGSNASPVLSVGVGTTSFGYTTSDGALGTGTVNRFVSGGPKWAPANATPQEILFLASSGTKSPCIAYRVTIGSEVVAGTYSATTTYTAVARF